MGRSGARSGERDVTAALVMVSQLRALFERLPHLVTPTEAAELSEFRRYRQTPGALPEARSEAVLTGFREAWKSGDLAAILDVGARLPRGIYEQDLDIQMYHAMAQRRSAGFSPAPTVEGP